MSTIVIMKLNGYVFFGDVAIKRSPYVPEVSYDVAVKVDSSWMVLL
ncbi:hypothetical protein LCGC14_2030860 [marine sediment metagenome]|uniref:Uncharacterized protein n=1 Tax=marine sediment metagenome TaxID=412755 RepID=A0A0F9FHC0_9ZZZZ